MGPLCALNLQDPGLHRSIATSSLQRMGYGTVLEVSHSALALRQLREIGGVHLLLCDLRIDPAARLDFLQAVAHEHLTQGVVVFGELAPATWPALASLLRLQGVQALRMQGGPATQERMKELLDGFDPFGMGTLALPSLREIPSDQETAAALGRGEIRAAFQPKVSVITGGISGFEVLARWQRGNNEVLMPGQFLPALRRNGLLDPLLFTLMDQALSILQAHGDSHYHLAFNLDPSQLARPGFAAQVEHRLLSSGADLRRITFELTETGALQMPAISLDNLLRLRLLGCGLAIDDFGSGQSTLERLVDLPFTEMKLDARFLADLDNDPRRGAVLAAALALGRALSLPVVAEGVETQGQFRQLQQLGCERAQGHYFCKPVMGHALTRLLRSVASDSAVEQASGNLPRATWFRHDQGPDNPSPQLGSRLSGQ
ncbi:EAL domain-containing response regulator [Pseudomonas nitroreducens]|uniref:EAL domain-containing response regulator n=1 Tax=Pseudomonas nitroreducens TaxID=46680 RepID=UPI00265AEEB1|nr:EAL domain-containing response regulator [Pseudomonas nitroreducens]MCP1649825.1 EAL domain-containing protein (putative c-di-GMP-specific phosphodiesterase class I) [Pseudomonas nitroreducens]MCP1687446.1 EAL domain-containing protein (putative c-di-GMP-specific phosphodiesterase class I) [Pseudomonas nitroreducens]